MKKHILPISFRPVGPQQIDCDGAVYKSFADAALKAEFDKNQSTVLSFGGDQHITLPPGVTLQEAPREAQDSVTRHLLNNGTVTVTQGSGHTAQVLGAYVCRPGNS
ncbi:MAG: hypothetical protein SFW65_04710 [Alphaproteobacteria bacterium]|nr:hypothetical protein [Alphaproteobacteria bacterium]